MKVIPINNGYYNIKSIKGKFFPSRITKLLDNQRLTNKYDIIKFEDEFYGIGVGEPSFKLDKTSDQITKLFVLNMLCKFSKKKEEDFKISLTSPPLFYKQQKESLPEYLKGKYEIEYNGKPRIINIEDVVVYPETFIAYCNYIEQYTSRLLLIIDIGGYTTNVCRIKQGAIVPTEYFTIQRGMYNINEKISQHINSVHYTSILPDDMEFYYKNGLHLNNKVEDILAIEEKYINNIFDKHIDNIISTCASRNWDIKAHDVLCIGGGSLVLFDRIENAIPHAVLSDTPVFDNLNAQKILTEVLFDDKEI